MRIPCAMPARSCSELKKFSADLAKKERWLVLNKLDLLPADEAEQRCKDIVRRLALEGAGLSDFRSGPAGHGGSSAATS